MHRLLLRGTGLVLLLSGLWWQGSVSQAGDPGQYMGYYAFPHPAYGPSIADTYHGGYVSAQGGYQAPAAPLGNYPQLNGSLYPSPRNDIPQEVGGTLITNQALYPHEMLYAHEYKAFYPTWNKVRWRWGWRWGCTQNKNGRWVPSLYKTKIAKSVEPMGTTVKVKYHSEIFPRTLFLPPN